MFLVPIFLVLLRVLCISFFLPKSRDDMYAQDSIDLLQKSGINFQKHEDYGIDVHHFGELLISSGFVLLDEVKWISFHRYKSITKSRKASIRSEIALNLKSSPHPVAICNLTISGYDFGYLLKILTCSPLPAEEGDFFDLLRTYFPCIYDIKYLMKSCKNLKGGLQELANDLQVRDPSKHKSFEDGIHVSFCVTELTLICFASTTDIGSEDRTTAPSWQRQSFDMFNLLQNEADLFRGQDRRCKVPVSSWSRSCLEVL